METKENKTKLQQPPQTDGKTFGFVEPASEQHGPNSLQECNVRRHDTRADFGRHSGLADSRSG